MGAVFVKSILAYYLFGYYLATIYKTSKKLVLWYVNEDEGPGVGPILGQANIPDMVDIGK